MRYNDDAQLDTSEVTDDRGAGGGGFSAGGLGLFGLLLPLLFRGRSGRVSGLLSTPFRVMVQPPSPWPILTYACRLRLPPNCAW